MDIVKVIILDSKLKRLQHAAPIVSANIDLYTSNNEVIEVWSDDRDFIEGCVKANKEDPRDQFRKNRRNCNE